jgi:hypothetical protein
MTPGTAVTRLLLLYWQRFDKQDSRQRRGRNRNVPFSVLSNIIIRGESYDGFS